MSTDAELLELLELPELPELLELLELLELHGHLEPLESSKATANQVAAAPGGMSEQSVLAVPGDNENDGCSTPATTLTKNPKPPQ